MKELGEIREKKLTNDTWILEYSDGGSTSYVLKGDMQAIMIDPGYGLLDCREFAEELLGMEVKLAANTHGHFDHAGGNEQFERVYLSKEAEIQAKTPYPSLCQYEYDFTYETVYVEDGYKIDLGNRVLEAFLVPNHSPGDVVWLDARERILYVGDFAGYFVPMIYQVEDPQPSVERFSHHLKRLLKRRDEYDWLCTGHGDCLISADVLKSCLENANHILTGELGEMYQMPKGEVSQPKDDWKWHGPRMGDFKMFLPEYKRVSRYAGTTIEYDMRYIKER